MWLVTHCDALCCGCCDGLLAGVLTACGTCAIDALLVISGLERWMLLLHAR